MQDDMTALHTTSYNISYLLSMPSLAHSIPCPASDRCDAAESLTHQSAASVALAAPVALTVPDMWSRAEDNLLVQTIATTIRLNDYNPTGLFLASGCIRDPGPPAAL